MIGTDFKGYGLRKENIGKYMNFAETYKDL